MSRILIIDPLPAAMVAGIRQALPAGVDVDCVESLEAEDFARRAEDAEVLVVIHRRVDASLLSLAPRVRFVQRCGVGYDNLDPAALAAAGVRVAYTPGANDGAVAEHAILLMLALLKRLQAAGAGARRAWRAAALAAREGIAVMAISAHSVEPPARGGLVFGFAGTPEEAMPAAVRRLATVLALH